MTELINSNWLTGPEFLWEREIVTPKLTSELMVGDPEVRTTQVLHTQVENKESFLVRLERFSKWHTALNVVARIQRLAKRTKETGPVSVEERRNASLALIKLAQNQAFKEEIQVLGKGKLPCSHPLYQLDQGCTLSFFTRSTGAPK